VITSAQNILVISIITAQFLQMECKVFAEIEYKTFNLEIENYLGFKVYPNSVQSHLCKV